MSNQQIIVDIVKYEYIRLTTCTHIEQCVSVGAAIVTQIVVTYNSINTTINLWRWSTYDYIHSMYSKAYVRSYTVSL